MKYADDKINNTNAASLFIVFLRNTKYLFVCSKINKLQIEQ